LKFGITQWGYQRLGDARFAESHVENPSFVPVRFGLRSKTGSGSAAPTPQSHYRYQSEQPGADTTTARLRLLLTGQIQRHRCSGTQGWHTVIGYYDGQYIVISTQAGWIEDKLVGVG